RVRSSHKGTYGHVLLIGGSRGSAGAIALAARAAARSGAGLTTALVPAPIQEVVASASLETMVHGGAATETGSLAASAWDAWADRVEEFDAVLIGPGLSRHPDSRLLVRRVLADCRTPLVIDADGLNALAGDARLMRRARCPVLITPHPGELARLLGRSVADIQGDRAASARDAANETGAIVTLKGAGTIVTARERTPFINLTGNPGMATGGSGDVLAGLLTGLAGQGIEPFEACKAAVFLHGRAGDMAAWRMSQTGMIAGDIVKEIGYVFRELTWR
ncbi:MAG: NAD(P)H-hydrate dehydratase, partial [Kiritimatiellia bacterium]|nr:NAD(P)H-hydrate dehydratase [Kiritimatiellia bacterium]